MQSAALSNALSLIGRILLAAIFIRSGYGKFVGYDGTAAYMAKAGVPGTLLPLVIAVELLDDLLFDGLSSPTGLSLRGGSSRKRRASSESGGVGPLPLTGAGRVRGSLRKRVRGKMARDASSGNGEYAPQTNHATPSAQQPMP